MNDRLDRIEGRLGSVEVKLERVEIRLVSVEGRLEHVEKKVDAVDKKVDAVDKKVDAVDKKVDELSNSTKIEFERVREDIKRLGEGYEQGLEKISRELKGFNSNWSDKFELHDMALVDHAKRITTLEQK